MVLLVSVDSFVASVLSEFALAEDVTCCEGEEVLATGKATVSSSFGFLDLSASTDLAVCFLRLPRDDGAENALLGLAAYS